MRETLGDRLKRVRSSRGLGLRATASRVGISPTYLSRVENNLETSPPSEEKIQNLAKVLEEDFDELMQLAGRVPAEVSDLIKTDTNMPAFLRRAREKNFSAEDLMEMLERQKPGEK